MKRFDTVKTLQLILLLILTATALATVLRDPVLYGQMASDRNIRRLGILLWIVLGLSFVFLFYDFGSWSDLKRENLELDHAIYSDALTGVANRYSVDLYIAQFLNKPLPADMGCVTLALKGLDRINAVQGHEGGDAAIRDFSEILMKSVSGVCFVGRNGGDRFVAICRDGTVQRLESFLRGVEAGLEQRNREHPDAPLHCSTGTAFREGEQVRSVAELVALSDRRARQTGA